MTIVFTMLKLLVLVFLASEISCALYPSFPDVEEVRLKALADDNNVDIVLNMDLPMFSSDHMSNKIKIFANGFMVLGDAPKISSSPMPAFYSRNWNWKNLDRNVVLIAPYFTDLFVGNVPGFIPSTVSYQELIEDGTGPVSKALKAINKDISNRNPKFKADHAVIISFRKVFSFQDYQAFDFAPANEQNFQLVLASDGIITYGVINYQNVKPVGRIEGISGFFENHNCRNKKYMYNKLRTSELDINSNIHIPGRYVILLSGVLCEAKKNPRFYCDEKPCLNGGICETNDVERTCMCIKGFNGTDCEIAPDITKPTIKPNRIIQQYGEEFGDLVVPDAGAVLSSTNSLFGKFQMIEVTNTGIVSGNGAKISAFENRPNDLVTYIRNSRKSDVLASIEELIARHEGPRERRAVRDKFQPVEVHLLTFVSNEILYQMMLVAGEDGRTFVVFVYQKAKTLVTATYSETHCSAVLLDNVNATFTSNVGMPGVHVFSLNSVCDKVLPSVASTRPPVLPTRSMDRSRVKPSRSIDVSHVKPSPSMDVSRVKPSPSMDVSRVKPSPSMDVSRVKPSRSIDVSRVKPSPSMDVSRVKPSPSIDISRVKPSPSMDVSRVKPSPSMDMSRVKPSPSMDMSRVKPSPSMDVSRVKPSRSMDMSRVKPSPSKSDVIERSSSVIRPTVTPVKVFENYGESFGDTMIVQTENFPSNRILAADDNEFGKFSNLRILNNGLIFTTTDVFNVFGNSPQDMAAYFRVEKSPAALERIKNVISRVVREDVQPIAEILITYVSADKIAQMMIVGDRNKKHYLVLSYRKENQLVRALFSNSECQRSLLLDNINATFTSNVGIPGVHVFSLSSFCEKESSTKVPVQPTRVLPSPSIDVSRGKPSSSMDVSRVKPSRSMDMSRVKPSPSIDVSRVKPSPSMDVSRVKPSPSMDVSRIKPSRSMDMSRVKPSPSMGVSRVKPSPSMDVSRVKPSHSMDMSRVKPSPSMGVSRVKPSPSMDVSRVKPSRSMDMSRVKPSLKPSRSIDVSRPIRPTSVVISPSSRIRPSTVKPSRSMIIDRSSSIIIKPTVVPPEQMMERFGLDAGDKMISRTGPTQVEIKIDSKIFGKFKTIKLLKNGKLSGMGVVVAPLSPGNSNVTTYYRIEKDKEMSQRIGKIIQQYFTSPTVLPPTFLPPTFIPPFTPLPRKRRDISTSDGIDVKELLIVTYNSTDFLTQLKLAVTNKDIFLILTYIRASKLVTSRYIDSDPSCPDLTFLSNENATHSSNVGISGTHIFKLTSDLCKKPTPAIDFECDFERPGFCGVRAAGWEYQLGAIVKGNSVPMANMTVPIFTNRTSGCLSFSYFISTSSQSMDMMKVWLKTPFHAKVVWAKQGDQGWMWRKESVRLLYDQSIAGMPFSLVFDTKGHGSVGLDNISVSGIQNCNKLPVLYPYGQENGDEKFMIGDNFEHVVHFNESLLFFTKHIQSLVVGLGYVGVDVRLPKSMNRSKTMISIYGGMSYGNSSSKLFYRKVEDVNILEMVAHDINSGETNRNAPSFYPKTLHLFTWFELFNFPNVQADDDSNTFQLALASDGQVSYAIMNYDYLGLNRENNFAGFSEANCSYRELAKKDDIRKMVTTSTNSMKSGQHIYLLTNRTCSHKVTGVRCAQSTVYPFFNIIQNQAVVKVSEEDERSHVSVTIVGLVTRQDIPALAIILNDQRFGRPTPRINNGYHLVRFGLMNMQRHNYPQSPSFMKQNVMMVLQGTPRSKVFQYGMIHVPILSTETVCVSHTFEQSMDEPIVILSPVVVNTADPYYYDFVTVWLARVRDDGFTVCAKEVLSFTGPHHNVSVSYVAMQPNLPNPVIDGNTEGRTLFVTPKQGEHKHCAVMPFRNVYHKPPSVFVTGEHQDSSQPILSWIKEVSRNSSIVCTTTSGNPSSINVMVIGKLDKCNKFQCPDYLECRLDRFDNPYCGCIRNCSGKNETFCGSDGKTYHSMCEFYQAHCWRHGNMSRPDITILHNGHCLRTGRQSGTTILFENFELRRLFCRYVNLDEKNFVQGDSGGEIKVFLTVASNDYDHIEQGSASWSEDVTTRSFKICVLQAGRVSKKLAPTVHWLAIQKESLDSQDSDKIGSKVFGTWYTGSRCEFVKMMSEVEQGTSPPTIVTSIEHMIPKTVKNAMTVWTEVNKRFGGYYISVCARELQNFDGRHEGIRVNWMVVDATQKPSFFGERHHVIFEGGLINHGEAIKPTCKSVYMNNSTRTTFAQPVIVAGAMVVGNIAMSNTSGLQSVSYSNYDVSMWVQTRSYNSLTVCMTSLQTPIFFPTVAVNVLTLSVDCPPGWIHFNGSCYTRVSPGGCSNFTDAHLQCMRMNAHLLHVSNEMEAEFLEERSYEGWLMFTNFGITWSTPNNFSRWLPGQPQSGHGNCAIMTRDGSFKPGWKAVDCGNCHPIVCQKAIHRG